MSFGWAEIGAGLASQGGTIWATERTNRANKEIARGQTEFQERMSRTAHQREVEDLKKAGLNPILSAGGNGASTPSGASATMQAPQIDTTPIFQALAFGQRQQEIDMQRQMIGPKIQKTTADAAKANADTRLKQKGVIRSDLEGEISSFLKNMIKKGRQSFDTNSSEMLRQHRERVKQMREGQPTVDPLN